MKFTNPLSEESIGDAESSGDAESIGDADMGLKIIPKTMASEAELKYMVGKIKRLVNN